MSNDPNIIYSHQDIDKYDYTVILHSQKDRYIAIGICSYAFRDREHWTKRFSVLITDYCLDPINELLAKDNDTIIQLFIVNNELLKDSKLADKFIITDRAMIADLSSMQASSQSDNINKFPLKHSNACESITNIQQLTLNPNDPLARVQFGNYDLYDILITACLQRQKNTEYSVYTAKSIGYLLHYDDTYSRYSKLDYERGNGRTIRWIAISYRQNTAHLDIAKTALEYSQTYLDAVNRGRYEHWQANKKEVTQAQINAFLNQQATNALPKPLQGQNGAIREQNKAISADNNASNPVNHGNISHQAGKTHLKSLLFLLILVIFCLPFTCAMAYTKGTTKPQAVKPNRHSLAIFVPILRGYYPRTTTGIKIHHTSYDGLREPNTIPFYGNKFRCLVAVVDAHHPIFSGDELLTKPQGGHYHA